jgi:hypothetical protein
LSTAQKEVDSARANMVSTLQSDGSKMTPVQRLNTAIEREFNIEGLTGAGAAPAAPVTTANLQQVTRGVLLKRQVGDLVQSSTATAGEATAAAEDTVVAKRLSFGLQQVLNNARLALASSSIPADNLIVTQRDAVQTLMGSLAKKVEDEQKEAEQTIGAAAATSSDEDTNAAAGAAAAETRSAARVQLQSVYERCAGEPAS